MLIATPEPAWDHGRVRDDLGERQFVPDSPEEPLVRILRERPELS